MQRQPYPPANAASPPLHHPVPQHVSTVPMMRSPPPPHSVSNSNYGSPYGGGGQPGGAAAAGPGPNQFAPNFGGFMDNPTAAMGMQFGQSAAMAGAQYLEQNASKWLPTSALKHYFNVTTSYVLRKVIIVVFPWRHKPWARQQRPSADGNSAAGYYYLPPREDVNSPDMYIPVMSFVTYVLLAALLAGLRGDFHPEVMGSNLSWAFMTVLLDIGLLKLGTYFLGITEQSQWLDLVAYSGYKFVGVIATLVIAEMANLGQGTGGWTGWLVFAYTYLANAFFLLRSLRYVLLPESSSSSALARSQKTQRTYFLFAYAYVVQLLFMWVLSRQSHSSRVLKA